MKYYINSTKTFDAPGANQPKGAITTYYKADKKESTILLDIVKEIIQVMTRDLTLEPLATQELWGITLKQHKKKRGGCYTLAEVVVDLKDQLEASKDVTESMVNRWNTAFSTIGLEDATIDVIIGKRPPVNKAPNIANKLFEEL